MSLRVSPHSRRGTLQDPLCHWYRYPSHVPGQWIPWDAHFKLSKAIRLEAEVLPWYCPAQRSWCPTHPGWLATSSVQMFRSLHCFQVRFSHVLYIQQTKAMAPKHCKKHNRVSKFESKHLQNISNPSRKPRILVMCQVWLFWPKAQSHKVADTKELCPWDPHNQIRQGSPGCNFCHVCHVEKRSKIEMVQILVSIILHFAFTLHLLLSHSKCVASSGSCEYIYI